MGDVLVSIWEIIKWIFGYFGIPSSILLALIENKFHILNRMRKWWAIRQNKGTDARISLEYKIEKDFKEVKEKFKTIFRKDKNFRIIKESNTRIDFIYSSFSIKLILNQEGNLFIETDRISCGIKDLKNKINELLGKLRELSNLGIMKEFISGDLSFTLPYKWDNLNVWKPKGLKIKKYSVSFSEKTYKSEVEISLNKVNIKVDTKEAISHVIEKFI